MYMSIQINFKSQTSQGWKKRQNIDFADTKYVKLNTGFYSHIVCLLFIMPIYSGCVYKLLQHCLVVREEKLTPLLDFTPADAGEWLLAEVSFWGKLVASRCNHACRVMTDEGKVNLDIISVYIFMEKMDNFPSTPLVSNHPV